MDKILIEVFFPAVGKTFDVEIPAKLRLQEITELVSRMFGELESEQYRVGKGMAVLCSRKTGAVFNAGSTPEELGWKNGEQLIFL